MFLIYDNCDFFLLLEFKYCLKEGYCLDFCVGYFNLCGWWELEDEVE